MTETRRAGRPNKAFLKRIKIAAVIVSVVAFAGSLVGVAVANPATANRSAQAARAASIAQAPELGRPLSGQSLLIPPQPQMPRLRPMTRTRGS